MHKSTGSRFARLPTFLKYSGLWIPFALTGAVVAGVSYFQPVYVWNLKGIAGVFSCGLCISLWVWSTNRIAKMNGRVDFPLLPLHVSADPMYQITYRTQALNRKPPELLLQKLPAGIVLGKSAGKYVCVIPDLEGAKHTLILGSTGAGKTSSILLCTLIAALGMDRMKQKYKSPTFVFIDVKGELLAKGVPADTLCATCNPRERSGWGFDCFYDLVDNSTEEQVLFTMRRVVFCLVDKKQNSSGDNDFWSDAARSVLTALFVSGWEKGYRNLPDLVDYALSDNLKTLINHILAESDSMSVVAKMLTPFGGEDAADETISSISMNIGNAISLLASDATLRFLLRECDRKIRPEMLEQGFHIDLQVADRDLEVYAPIFSLFLDTICYYLCSAEREHMIAENPLDNQVIIVADEWGRLPPVPNFNNILMLGRSRGVSLIAATQSWSAIEGIYGEHIAANMLANFPYRVFLQVQPESKDVDIAVKAFGKFLEKKKSISSGKNSSCNYSFQEQDVLLAKDLLELPFQNRVALVSPYGAYMINKSRYFDDKQLSKAAERIRVQKQKNTKEH